MPVPENQYSVPPEARLRLNELMARDGKLLLLRNRDTIDPEGWNRIEDGLPPCPTKKPVDLCWDVWDHIGGVRVSTIHPQNWNKEDAGGDPVEDVTHWRDRPKPPE